jgi:23S rRNA (adenine2030-N6)-methyltransferase
MNYRHGFHAGNFADVVKHALLARVVAHLLKKDAPFRVIDTHAGSGRTNLAGEQATRGGEWRDGIGRVFGHRFAPQIEELLAPYREGVAACNEAGALKIYPGSPLLILHWLRAQDRLIACELETGAAQALARNLRHDARAKAIAIDGWTALNAYIPPKERRGLVLIDPPFEDKDEFGHLAAALAAAHAKWRTGILLAWYPIKDPRAIAGFFRSLAAQPMADALRMELVAETAEPQGLHGTGLLCINPPYPLAAEARLLLPALARTLWPGHSGTCTVAPISAGGR